MHGYYLGSMMGWGVTGGVVMILFWVALAIFIVWVLRDSTGETNNAISALDILKQRYAKGEINKEEFDLKKGDLVA